MPPKSENETQSHPPLTCPKCHANALDALADAEAVKLNRLKFPVRRHYLDTPAALPSTKRDRAIPARTPPTKPGPG